MKPSKTRYWIVVAGPLLLPLGTAIAVYDLSAIGARLAADAVPGLSAGRATDMRLARSIRGSAPDAAYGSARDRSAGGDGRPRVAVRGEILPHAVAGAGE